VGEKKTTPALMVFRAGTGSVNGGGIWMDPAQVVQAQVDAFNAREDRFVGCCQSGRPD